MENKLLLEKEKEREREKERDSLVVGRAPIVLRAFLPVIRSPERSRLYHSVYPLFSSELLLFDTTTSHCTSLPVISPSRLPRRFFVAALGCFRSSSFSFSLLSHLLNASSPPFRFTRSYPLILNHAESIFIFDQSTVVKRVLYTFPRQDILFFSYEMRKCIICIKEVKRYELKSLFFGKALQKFSKCTYQNK